MSKRAWKKGGAKAPARKGPKFEIREGKDKRPFLMLSGVVRKTGRGGANVMLFSSKYEGSFGGLMVSGWRGGAIPIESADQVDIQDGEIVITFPWITVRAKGIDEEETVEFLNYIADLPKEKYVPPAEEEEGAAAPKKRSWKK